MSKIRPRLGRGLESLISVSDEVPDTPATPPDAVGQSGVASGEPSPPLPATEEIVRLRLDAIVPNPHQPRRQFDERSIAELAESLRATGLIQPVVVCRAGEQYQLIAGERRWRAAKLAGMESIPALLRSVDGFTQAQMALVENVQREDLNPLDRAAAYRSLMSQLGLTQAELAGRIGEDRSTIANFVRLLELAEPVQVLVREGKLSLGHAKLVAGVPDILEQEALARLAVEQGLSVRNLERLLQERQGVKPDPIPATPSAHFLDLEKSLSGQLGMRIQIRSAGRNKSRGKLILHYASLDQFDELLQKLGLKTE